MADAASSPSAAAAAPLRCRNDACGATRSSCWYGKRLAGIARQQSCAKFT